jgi:hypothetical protein
VIARTGVNASVARHTGAQDVRGREDHLLVSSWSGHSNPGMAESPELMIFVDVKSIEYVRQPAIRLVLPIQPRIGFI